jgi:hypothetical protein
MNLFGNRKTRKRFTRPEDRFGDVYLDARQLAESVTTTVTLPTNYPEFTPYTLSQYIPELQVVQGANCPNPGDSVPFTRAGDVLTLEEDMGGGDVYYGFNFNSFVTMPTLEVRDPSGVIQEDAKLRVTDWTATITGYTRALVSTNYDERAPYTSTYPAQEYRGVVMGNSTVDDVNYNRGHFRVQFRQDADNAELTFQSIDYIGMSLHQVEWRGTYYNSGRRF